MFFMIEDENDRMFVEGLYNKYKTALYRTAYRILYDKRQAEDAVHNTFVSVIQYLHKVKCIDENNQHSFLQVICRNKAIDIYRATKKKNTKEEYDSEMFNIPDSSRYNPLNICISNEGIRNMIDTVKSFKDTYRDVFILKYSSELENDEISKLLNISESNVRKRLQRGREQLLHGMNGR